VDDRLEHALREAERGELRPQLNPDGVLSALHCGLPGGSKAVEEALLRRFFELSRPIADASAGPRPGLRLQDAGRFFYLLEAVRRAGHGRTRELLWVLLDRFAELDERCYDELYLWCIVELSRADPAAALVLWPQALLLDLRHRAAPWRRPPGARPVDQPYRLTDLVFYFYVLYTLDRRGLSAWEAAERKRLAAIAPHDAWARLRLEQLDEAERQACPSLGSSLERLGPSLSAEQLELARRALQELAAAEKRPTFRDALGLLSDQRRRRRAAGPEPGPPDGVE
jgi:hypothetical protein